MNTCAARGMPGLTVHGSSDGCLAWGTVIISSEKDALSAEAIMTVMEPVPSRAVGGALVCLPVECGLNIAIDVFVRKEVNSVGFSEARSLLHPASVNLKVTVS